jgi:hypothetical protein
MKKLLIAVGIILAAFIITNPTTKDFKEFVGTDTYQGLYKEKNYLIFSVYYSSLRGKRYIGFLKNFILY